MLFPKERSLPVSVRSGLQLIPSMYSEMHYFRDLETIIDEVHGLFEGWESNHDPKSKFSLETLNVAKLAVHEWLANILQHADFKDRVPELGLHISPCGERLYCVIQDNSEGFDVDGYYDKHHKITVVLPDRGMGLLLLRSCTEELKYERQEGRQQLMFYVTASEDSYLEIPFS